MQEEVESILKDCLWLPSDSKRDPMYREMKEKIDCYEFVLPLI